MTMGGSDPNNATLMVIQALTLTHIDGLEAVILAGPANPHLGTLSCALPNFGSMMRLEYNVKDMPELMAWADIAISAGGSTTWELAFMGLPMILLNFAENQERVARGMERAGVALYSGKYADITAQKLSNLIAELAYSGNARSVMSQNAHLLVDGAGAARVTKVLRGMAA